MIHIKRNEELSSSYGDGQFGEIQLLGITMYTLEHNWVFDKDRWPYGRPHRSCVPKGVYDLVERTSTKYGRKMLYLHNPSLGVIGDLSGTDSKLRYDCSIQFLSHTGLWDEGSISVGLEIGQSDGRKGLIGSKIMNEFIFDYSKSFKDSKISIS